MEKKQDKSVIFGIIVGVLVFGLFIFWIGEREENGGRMRMHWLGALAYIIGGKTVLATMMGLLCGGLTWLFIKEH